MLSSLLVNNRNRTNGFQDCWPQLLILQDSETIQPVQPHISKNFVVPFISLFSPATGTNNTESTSPEFSMKIKYGPEYSSNSLSSHFSDAFWREQTHTRKQMNMYCEDGKGDRMSVCVHA